MFIYIVNKVHFSASLWNRKRKGGVMPLLKNSFCNKIRTASVIGEKNHSNNGAFIDNHHKSKQAFKKIVAFVIHNDKRRKIFDGDPVNGFHP